MMDFGTYGLSDTSIYHVDHPFEKDENGDPAKVFTDDGKPSMLELHAPHTRAFKIATAAHLKALARLQDIGKKKKTIADFSEDELIERADKKMRIDAEYAAAIVVGWQDFQINGKTPEFDRQVFLDIATRPGFISWLPAAIMRHINDLENFTKTA